MAKRKNGKSRKSPPKKGEVLAHFYAKHRREFSAADLQKYTEIEEGVPLKKVIAECEEIHRKHGRKN